MHHKKPDSEWKKAVSQSRTLLFHQNPTRVKINLPSDLLWHIKQSKPANNINGSSSSRDKRTQKVNLSISSYAEILRGRRTWSTEECQSLFREEAERRSFHETKPTATEDVFLRIMERRLISFPTRLSMPAIAFILRLVSRRTYWTG